MSHVNRILIVVAIACCCSEMQAQQAANAEAFEQHIAPLLARHCLECHSSTTKEGGLDLSTKKSALAGGESGAAITPGKLNASLLWEYISTDEMPKKRPPLSADEKAALKRWIEQGAAWPMETIDPFAYSSARRAGYDWWSLQPVKEPTLPPIKDKSWPRNDVDHFILAKLESQGLAPAPEADRRTLIRRLYFDLIGLPPEPEAVEKFLSDKSSQAYDKLVDDLLASPHYGERWARHWLDVVRFGESQGFERNRIRENAWRYRDWVINALNRDLPYDEFVRQQIAGDVLYPDDLDALLATGYHVCGTWDQVAHLEGSAAMKLVARQDHLEDLVATLGQAYLGLTINCARCHDHKFDPISQADYYQMAALLGGVTQQQHERRGIKTTRDPQRKEKLQAELAELSTKLNAIETSARKEFAGGESNSRPIAGLLAVLELPEAEASQLTSQTQDGVALELAASQPPRYATKEPPRELVKEIQSQGEFTVEVWLTPAKVQQAGPARIVTLSKDSGQRNFTLGHDDDKFDFRLRTTKTDQNGLPSLATPSVVNTEKMHLIATFNKRGLARIFVNGKQVSEKEMGGDLSNWDAGFRLGLGDEFSGERHWDGEIHFVAIYAVALDATQIAKNFATRSRDLRAAEPWETILAKLSPQRRSEHAALTAQRKRLESELEKLNFSGLAHVIIPQQPSVFHVLARGDLNKPKQAVAPRGLSAIARSAQLSDDLGLAPDAPEAERRKQLAMWLTRPEHPLTARVMVNRVWHYHFGVGIVDTPSDFGYSGGRPSHPELLDYLAARFVQDGWSLKRLHKLLVTSATYRQASRVANDKAEAVDAENRLWWRFNTRQIEGEAVRDAALAVSGALQRKLGGPSYRDVEVKLNQNHEFTDPTNEFSPETCRRTIYRLWARSGNNPLLQSLDCPDPSVMMPSRPGTITPVQALSLLNNAFMEKCAASFAERVTRETSDKSHEEQIRRAYLLALARVPTEQESTLAVQFVAEHGLAQFCLVLLNTNEFLFVN